MVQPEHSHATAAARYGEPPPPEPYHVVCDDLFKIYKLADLEVVALRGLDLRVRRGEMLGIVGASGSGKSTLLNILAGLDLPSAGGAFVNGRNLITMTEPDLVAYRRLEVGFIWQQTARNLIPYLTAQQNVGLPLILQRAAGSGARARELLEAVGLDAKSRQRPDQLSGGEQQRASIAVALANAPPLLLADEPTGELDSHTADEIFALLTQLNRDFNVTVIIVTHDPAIAARVDRVVTLRDGQTASETERSYAYDARGAPHVVHTEYTVVDRMGRVHLPKPYRDALALRARAQLHMRGDHVSVYPAETDGGGDAESGSAESSAENDSKDRPPS